jgi:7-cyano-7-deazaguanine tRNA-ribosyltransferase
MIWREQIIDKLRVLFNVKTEDAVAVMEGVTYVKSKTGRVRNVIASDGKHLFSPTLSHGGMSMTIEGAKWAHSLDSGLARVTVIEDAEPFIRKGRNVFHAFVSACDDLTRIGEMCLIVNSKDELLGIGVAQCDAKEMLAFSKGIAVKVRAGNPPLMG